MDVMRDEALGSLRPSKWKIKMILIIISRHKTQSKLHTVGFINRNNVEALMQQHGCLQSHQWDCWYQELLLLTDQNMQLSQSLPPAVLHNSWFCLFSSQNPTFWRLSSVWIYLCDFISIRIVRIISAHSASNSRNSVVLTQHQPSGGWWLHEHKLKGCSPAGHGALEEVDHLLGVLLWAVIEINPIWEREEKYHQTLHQTNVYAYNRHTRT